MRKKSVLVILMFVFFVGNFSVFGQLSKKHFIPPLTYAEAGNANPENQYFYISTPKDKNVTYTIKPVGQPVTDYITGVVSKNTPKEIFIGTGDTQLFQSALEAGTVTKNKGYIIEADDVIYVSIRVLAGNDSQAGALVSKGLSGLGTTFRAGMFTNENPEPNTSNYLSFISVMATENNTKVTFSDITAGVILKNYIGMYPINITLNEGENYVLAANSSDGTINNDGLIGALINSDKPIVTNVGSANGSFHNGNGRDYGIDQIVSASKIGSKYILVKGEGNNNWENVLVVAHQDNTTITVNQNTTFIAINAGEYFVIEGDNFDVNGNMFLETSSPAFVYQGIGANNSEANQGLFFVPPLSCENKGKVDNIPIIEKIGSIDFSGGITIVTNKGATVSIKSETQTFTPLGPFDVTGNPNYVTYKVSNLSGNISIESSAELYCAYFNQNGAASSGGFYSGFPSAPEINFDATVSSLGNCIPNITLDATNTSLFDDFEWFFDDENGGGFIATGEKNISFSPKKPGKYKLRATINCSRTTFDSAEVPVSICPDDYDKDLVIDNLDVDIDNDGILNCEESLGDANFDLSDITNPAIIFQDTSRNSTIISSTFSQTNTGGTANIFTGNTSGNFISSINAGSASSLKYILNTTKNINLKFTYSIGAFHTSADGEYFEIKVSPNSKNLTLLDPDDLLLIDSNFDGIYESNIKNISASVIRFKFNPVATGTTPFQFLANSINQIVFEHHSDNLQTTSTFNGNFLLTCFARDSDNDGIEDAFDLDSDNDGISDIQEQSELKISLLNKDTNFNGLDDVFIAKNTKIDSDSDGVLNYLDVDSDNDGIYDLVEAGHTELDVNNDGVIDNAVAKVGVNGLVNSLETSVDSGVLSYIFADSDGNQKLNFTSLDSDNDTCKDVVEAGFLDVNDDGYLGGLPVQVSANGKVTNTVDGYTMPNQDYVLGAPIILNSPFEDVSFCDTFSGIITVDSNADTFQWQEKSSSGTSWNDLQDGVSYTGITTKDLKIMTVSPAVNQNKYRVILGKTGNSCGLMTNEIALTVNPLPILKTNQAQIRQCINTNNGLSTINLTTAQINISDNPNGTFEFYEDSAGTTKISNFTSYPVDANSNPPKSVWVKAISEFGCDSKLVELILTIGTAADRPYDETFIACDDFLDTDGNDTPGSNSDTDGITLFQLNKTAVIANINTNSNIDVFFYETEKDRQEATNTIDIANYRNKNIPNSTGNKFPIYYRLINKINNDCTGIGQIYLQIQPVPLAFTPNDFIFCDDVLSGSTTDGENIGTNLRTRVPDILGATQTETAFSVSFHTTKNGAITNADIITNETDFRNTAPSTFSPDSPSEQIIYVRVENKNTTLTCINPHVSFKIIVNPLPTIAAAVTPLSVCDITTPTDANAKNRIAENIDLTTKNTEILAGKTNHKITFFTTQAHADAGTPVIANPTNFTNDLIHTVFPSNLQSDDPGRQTIYYTITQEIGNQCTSVVASFNVDVYPEPNLPTTITDYSVCDNISDSFGSDANGFNGDIALKTKVSEILVNYQPNKHSDFKVGFYSNLADAKSGNTTKEINQDVYQNIQKSETVFVRVENIKNTGITCANTKLSFNIEVTPLPSFTVLGEENIDNPQILCLNNLPFILDVESPLGNYSYQWRNEAGIIIGNQRKLTIAAEGKYTVTATDISPNTCTRTRTTVVKASNVANLLDAFVEISDESTALGSGQNIAVKIDTINNNLGPGAYQFALLNTETNERIPSLGFQDEPLFEEIEGGIYTVIVNDKNGCSPDAMLTISVIQFPKFFTPNGDGWNDFWKIKGVSKTFYSSRILNIFDRFGRLLTQVPFDEKGWDGTINGNILSTNDYWFDIQIVPIDTNKSPIYKKGHFTLLRR